MSQAHLATATPVSYWLSKRLFDVLLACIGLIIASPALLLAMALAMLLHCRAAFSKTPQREFLLAQEFVGRDGKICRWWQLNLANTGAIAPMLRACGIASSLRLLAVLAGDLAIVGPRARTRAEAEESEFANSAVAQACPGLLCLAWLRQRGNLAFNDEMQADLDYLQQRSLRKDCAILLRAAIVLCYGQPAKHHAACETIAGIRLLNLAMDNLLAAIEVALAHKLPTRIAFVNADCVNLAAQDPAYRQCLQDADWICADGIGMKIAGHLLHREIRQNLNGTDLLPPLCEMLAAHQYSIFLLGAKPSVAAECAAWIKRQHPQLRVAGYQHGYFAASDDAAIAQQIRASRADVLLVAMGAARQEKWLQAHFASSGCCIAMGVGGLFDFYSGRMPRAPMWLREIGGEWLYRLWQEPGRMWRRYLLGNGRFLVRILLEKWRSRKNQQQH